MMSRIFFLQSPGKLTNSAGVTDGMPDDSKVFNDRIRRRGLSVAVSVAVSIAVSILLSSQAQTMPNISDGLQTELLRSREILPHRTRRRVNL